jgi:tetratricopeptide (TPR) repeat protein
VNLSCAVLFVFLSAGQADAPATVPQETAAPPGRARTAPSEAAPLPPARQWRRETSLAELWGEYVRLDTAGRAEEAGQTLQEIRRLRIERNIDNLETIGLGLVARGVTSLDEGERETAEESFARTVRLAPGLPDGHYGRAVARLKKGPLGVVPSMRAMTTGILEFLPTARGHLRSTELVVVWGLLAAFLVTWALGLALVAQHGALLRHDLEEWLGPEQNRSASLGLTVLALLFPVAAFQGWGWLPLWWLAVLFSYFNRVEKAVAIVAFAALVAAGPALEALAIRVETAQNPLYQAAISTVEGEPAPHEIALLQAAARADPEDRDLAYLLGAAWRRSGRVRDAAALYGRLLVADRTDTVARNNLANLEFALGQHESALVRYRQGSQGGGPSAVVATSLYNLSLAHLQKFEYQAYNEAKSSADRLSPGRVSGYDRWKYDSGDYAVVDLGLSREDVWRKFAGRAEGVGVRNVYGTGRGGRLALRPESLLNRFTVAALLLAIVAIVFGRVRGAKAFTVHCSMCGTAFCRQCHLGQVIGDLCSQCYHMFVVRDGVSGPARNRKMLDVQAREVRRGRIFRLLCLVSPGAGHVYARQTLVGVLLMTVWYTTLAGFFASRLVPLTEVSSRLTPPWAITLLVVLLAAVWAVANRLQPDFEVALPRRGNSRRASRTGRGA